MNWINNKTLLFGIIVISFLLFFYTFSSICFPFIVGFILAYIFVPTIDFISRQINRTFVCFILTILFISIFIMAGLELIPRLKQYILHIADNLPTYYNNFIIFISRLFESENTLSYHNEIASIKTEIQKYFDQKIYITASILGRLVSQKNTIVEFISFFIIMPISFFYFAKDWKSISSKIYDFIPLRQHHLINESFNIIRKSLFRFFHAQFYVVAILSIYYSSVLLLINLHHPIFWGILSGFFSFIPFIGAILSGFIVVFVSIPHLTMTKFYLIIATYFLGQFIEGYFLSPKFVGRKTGLHPLWILFSFFAGYKTLGIVGVLIAIPVIAICRSLINLYIIKFHASQAYKQ